MKTRVSPTATWQDQPPLTVIPSTYDVLSCLQTDATTPKMVRPTMLGVVASVLAVVCKRMQQLPTLLRPAMCIVERIQLTPRRPCVRGVRGPNNVGRALGRGVQTDPTLLRYASVITKKKKKCWELFAQKFDQFEILRNKMQQGVQTDATCNIQKCW